jgi:hypothetical protein
LRRPWAEIIFAVAVIAAGLGLNAIGSNAYPGFLVAAILLAVVIGLNWLSERRVDKTVVEKVEMLVKNAHEELLAKVAELSSEFQDAIEQTRYEIFRHWRGNTSFVEGNTYAAVVRSDAALVLERTSTEICVWAYRLVWETEDPDTLEVVRYNLARGAQYRYILPDTTEVRIRVRQFIAKLKMNLDDVNLEFRIRDSHESLFDQCVTIYFHANHSTEPVVVLFPPKVDRAVDHAQFFVQLEGPAAAPIRENFDAIWSNLEKLDPKG